MQLLRDFWEIHPDSEQQLKSWYQETSKAEWPGPNQIKPAYPSASFPVDKRVVFNIKGNHCVTVGMNVLKNTETKELRKLD